MVCFWTKETKINDKTIEGLVILTTVYSVYNIYLQRKLTITSCLSSSELIGSANYEARYSFNATYVVILRFERFITVPVCRIVD